MDHSPGNDPGSVPGQGLREAQGSPGAEQRIRTIGRGSDQTESSGETDEDEEKGDLPF